LLAGGTWVLTPQKPSQLKHEQKQLQG